ncbi:unnamed protein product, partial [Mycena citricolor]
PGKPVFPRVEPEDLRSIPHTIHYVAGPTTEESASSSHISGQNQSFQHPSEVSSLSSWRPSPQNYPSFSTTTDLAQEQAQSQAAYWNRNLQSPYAQYQLPWNAQHQHPPYQYPSPGSAGLNQYSATSFHPGFIPGSQASFQWPPFDPPQQAEALNVQPDYSSEQTLPNYQAPFIPGPSVSPPLWDSQAGRHYILSASGQKQWLSY